jgi:ribonuclease D
MLSSPASVGGYLSDLRRRGVGEIALDLEADQGSYRYRSSVSIFQCFDGREAAIIDVLALRGGLGELRELLEAPDIAKVMFSSKNDLFITQNVLGCGIAPIRDIAVAQKMLGLKVNLSDALGIDKKEKDKFQRANWLLRPISGRLLEYAAGDVAQLLRIYAGLRESLAERKLLSRFEAACDALPRTDYRVDQYRLYERKFPGYNRLRPPQRELARLVWVFRELAGEHFDVPVGYLVSTKAMPEIIDGLDPIAEDAAGAGAGAASGTAAFSALADRLERALNAGRRPEKRIERGFVERKLGEAARAVATEGNKGSRK